ncbi:MAG: 50S ribosomal protein L11 methyltransferase [Desulfocapsaceae bacterium]|nr:50S ribosomal protein L11 methyltransferase [Desulfocapsaceae bacterium]
MSNTPLTPDSLLYIYYLEGKISKDRRIVNKNYLGTWEEDGFSFLFFLKPASEDVNDLLAADEHLQLLDTFEMTYEQWQGGKLEPQQLGSFLVCPPWFSPPEGEPSQVITLDPGVVFGNGLHPTTRDCLQAIEIVGMNKTLSSMLDLGTGTGILALAAASLGCQKVLAVDFNYLAAQTAQRNVVANGFENKIVTINGQAEPFTALPCDLLVANIHYDIMKDIISSSGFLRQKWFILSGLLKSETEKIERQLAAMPVHILNKWTRDGTWHTILGITAAE